MRRLLLRILLVAVFLNTAIGMPLHAAAHLEVAATAVEAEDGEGGHPLCAWCFACAHQFSAPPPAPVSLPPCEPQVAQCLPAATVALGFSAGLWASSPRGPPTF
jgi:hypothetical protein